MDFLAIILLILRSLRVARDGRFYVVQDGKARFLKKGIVIDTPATEVEFQIAEAVKNEAKEVAVYQYLKLKTEIIQGKFGPEEKEMVERVVSTFIPSSEAEEAYRASLETNTPVKFKIGATEHEILTLNGGDYHFPFIEALLAGRDWAIRTMAVNDLALKPSLIADMLKNAQFAFASASVAHFIYVKGETSWGLTQFGLVTRSKKKLVKRLQELTRFTKTGLWTDQFSLLVMNLSSVPEEYVDGKGYISRSFAARIYGTINNPEDRERNVTSCLRGTKAEVIGRFIVGQEEVKGNFIILPDRKMFRQGVQYDIIVHSSAVKDEMGLSTPMSFFTAWDYENCHVATWDSQSLANFSTALTLARQNHDLKFLKETLVSTLEEGTIPEFLSLGERGHREEAAFDYERSSNLIQSSYARWQMAGHNIRAAQHILYMAYGGLVQKMIGSDGNKKEEGRLKKHWLPMTNAAALSIVTYESLALMAQTHFSKEEQRVCRYDRRFGLIMPGARFMATFAHHDGWDLDDVLRIYRMLIWSSDQDMVQLGKDNGSIPVDLEIPTAKEEAIEVVFTWRTPNAPGGWAIEEFDFSTWPEELKELYIEDRVSVIDVANLSKPLPVLLAESQVGTLTSSTVYTGRELTKSEANEMVLTQTTNPNVGNFVNPLILWASATQGKSYPPVMPCTLNDAVDSMQQGYDATEFGDIALGIDSMIAQIIDLRVEVDASVAVTRFSSKLYQQFTKVKGRQTAFDNSYAEAIRWVKTEIQNKTLQMRVKEPLVVQVVGDESIRANGSIFYEKWESTFASILRDYRKKNAFADNAFAKANAEMAKNKAVKDAVSDMMQEVNSWGEAKYERVLSLWKYILTPTREKPYGISDRIMFQAGHAGQDNLMDVLIEALDRRGLV
jgi:hypothetical protein